MLAEVGQNQEQSNNNEFLVDSGAACHAWSCKTKNWFIPWRDIFDCHRSASCITGTLDASFQLVDVHGVEINVSATFELLLSAVQS